MLPLQLAALFPLEQDRLSLAGCACVLSRYLVKGMLKNGDLLPPWLWDP